MKRSALNLFLGVVVALTATGCGRNIGSSNYSSASVGEAMTTYAGVVTNVRKVQIQEGDKLTDNVAGGVVGGLLGGLGGHLIGGGRGNTVATAGGALLGAGAGAMAQRALSEQEGLEYTVKLDTGSMMTVVQGEDSPLVVGQRALVQVSKNRSRVVPA